MNNKLKIGALLGLMLASSGWAAESTIYMEHFNGTGPLNGQTTHNGNKKWVAGSAFNKDGSVTTEAKYTSATLPFNPQPNRLYILKARITSKLIPESNYQHWIALGYANGQSDKTSTANRFTDSKGISLCEGRAWAYIRPIFNKPGSGNFNSASLKGTTSIGKFKEYEQESDLDIRIDLNTTDAWTATWYAKHPADSEYKEVISSHKLIETNITSVGFSKSEGVGLIDNFSLNVVGELSREEWIKTTQSTETITEPTSTNKAKPAKKEEPDEKINTLGIITS